MSERKASGSRPESLRHIRRKCARLVDRLPLESATSVISLCQELGDARRRPIVIAPMPSAGGGICGMWLSLETTDLVFYDQASTGTHREHIIAHELGHMICGHHGADVVDANTARHLFPDLAPELVRSALQRATYSDVQELEAEVTASLILQRLVLTRTQGERSVGESDATAARIAATLMGQTADRPRGDRC
jgi:hypothetical protein